MIVKIPHSLAPAKDPVRAIDLHVFGDTSGIGTGAAVYAVVHQDSSTNQGLVTAKARLAKKGPTVPRLEPVPIHVAANLVDRFPNVLVPITFWSLQPLTELKDSRKDAVHVILAIHLVRK